LEPLSFLTLQTQSGNFESNKLKHLEYNMQIKKFVPVLVFLIALVFSGFQCSSTELTSAKLYIQQKNYDKAIDALQKEVQKNPKSDEGYYLLGVVLGEKERYSEMTDAYNKSLSISNKFSENIGSSKKYFWANLFNKGVGYYQKGTKSDDKDSAKIYFDKSIDAFKSAIEVEPDSADTYKNLAFVYMSSQEYDNAISPLEKLIEKENALDGYRFLSEIYYVKGVDYKSRYDNNKVLSDSLEAMKYFDKAIGVAEQGRKHYPDDSDILLTLSNAYIGANKIEVAIDAFKTGVEKDPMNQYYRYNYGVLLLGKNDFAGAEEQFKKALEIDPEYYNASYNLAVTYVKWGAYINKVADEKGDLNNKEYKEKYQKALPYLEKIVQNKKDDAQMWELLGKVYSVLGMQDDATNAFNKADELRK
jgi:tetratricopeptide (TPR) repeat protein